MPAPKPTSTCEYTIDGLGTVKGLLFENGVRQFCGIPYASLSKRWTRSVLQQSWPNDYHDGTDLGCPHPGLLEGNESILTPVPPIKHFREPPIDELNALVMNIVLPPLCSLSTGAHAFPIFVYTHGGSLLYGGANLSIFDSVNLVSLSMAHGKPTIAINFNYRVGIGGFLAGRAIQKGLSDDGYAGSGNFGFTDQKVAFDWVQKYGRQLRGDIDNVTNCGESAGGISISNQLSAASVPNFHRAICMSGLSCSIPVWTMEEHDRYFEAICRHFSIDPAADDALTKLREIPIMTLADATPLIQGVPSGTGNPCLDGWFYSPNCDPNDLNPVPPQIKSYMFGDVYHEGVIFTLCILDDPYDFWLQQFNKHIEDPKLVARIFELYNIHPDLPKDELRKNFEHMAGDAIFKIPDYVLARQNQRLSDEGNLFLYHFDQRSRLKNELEGTAYHAHELLFLFNNLHEEFNRQEVEMGRDFALAWIDFANGIAPWSPAKQPNGEYLWKVWGPDCSQGVKSEQEDEEVRNYARMEAMLNIGEPGVTWHKWFRAIDDIVNKRMNMGRSKV